MSDATIEIKKKYKELDGKKGFLGAPIINPVEELTLDTPAHQHYEHGIIYFSPETGAHEVHGAILVKYETLSDVQRRKVGLPTSDETRTPDDNIRYSTFQGCTIIWSPDGGTRILYGRINEKWLSLTGEVQRTLGYPNTDQFPTPDGNAECIHFSNGAIYSTNNYGAHVVYGRIYVKWRDLGWEHGQVNGSTIGYPTTDVTIVDRMECGPGGEVVRFQGVTMYGRTGHYDAYAVGGGFKLIFESAGGERTNGFPQSDSFFQSGGYTQGFDCAMIYSKAGCGIHLVPQPILREYYLRNNVIGCLGFPRSDYLPVAGTTGHWYQLFEHGRIDFNAVTGTATSHCDTTGGGSSSTTQETDVLLVLQDFIGGLEHYQARFIGRAVRLQNTSGRNFIFVKYNPDPNFAISVLHSYAMRNPDGSLVIPENNYIFVPDRGIVNAGDLRLPDNPVIDAGLISNSGGGGRDGADRYTLHIWYSPI